MSACRPALPLGLGANSANYLGGRVLAPEHSAGHPLQLLAQHIPLHGSTTRSLCLPEHLPVHSKLVQLPALVHHLCEFVRNLGVSVIPPRIPTCDRQSLRWSQWWCGGGISSLFSPSLTVPPLSFFGCLLYGKSGAIWVCMWRETEEELK